MQVNMLSIGIWVRCQEEVARVKEVESEWITVETAKGLRCVAPVLIAPLPLSPTLLEGMGFQVVERRGKVGYGGYITWEAHDNGFFFSMTQGLANSLGRDWTLHIDNADRQTLASCDIAYMHQMQQLAALVDYEGSLFTVVQQV